MPAKSEPKIMNKYLYFLLYWSIAAVLIAVLFMEKLLIIPVACVEALEGLIYYHLSKNA